MAAANRFLDDSRRASLMALADVLVPADERTPAASDADADGAWVERVLSVRSDLVPVLTRTLDSCDLSDTVSAVRRLKAEDADGFLALATVVTGAYYLNPDIRRRYGFPAQEPSLPDPDEANRDLRDGILDAVIQRGPIFRPTPS